MFFRNYTMLPHLTELAFLCFSLSFFTYFDVSVFFLAHKNQVQDEVAFPTKFISDSNKLNKQNKRKDIVGTNVSFMLLVIVEKTRLNKKMSKKSFSLILGFSVLYRAVG